MRRLPKKKRRWRVGEKMPNNNFFIFGWQNFSIPFCRFHNFIVLGIERLFNRLSALYWVVRRIRCCTNGKKTLNGWPCPILRRMKEKAREWIVQWKKHVLALFHPPAHPPTLLCLYVLFGCSFFFLFYLVHIATIAAMWVVFRGWCCIPFWMNFRASVLDGDKWDLEFGVRCLIAKLCAFT